MKRAMLIVSGLVAVAACVSLNVDVYQELYSSGPPYYGRTENMDKWTSPLPWLIPVDGFLVAILMWIGWRLFRR
jgi:hypothetical protein